jgi:hypothetical protein
MVLYRDQYLYSEVANYKQILNHAFVRWHSIYSTLYTKNKWNFITLYAFIPIKQNNIQILVII